MASSSSSEQRVLVVGGDSLIGGALEAALRADGVPTDATTRRPAAAGAGRPLLDLERPDWPADLGRRYSTAFLCAAVARLDACHADPERSERVNVTNLVRLARDLTSGGCRVLFLSTNQVFGGTDPFPTAATPVSPTSVYGRQKAAAEAALLSLAEGGAAPCILRLSKVVQPGMPLFAGWIDALRQGRMVRAASDMSLAPVPLRLVVATLRRLGERRAAGIHQLSSATEISYADAALHLAERLGVDPALVQPVLTLEAGFLKEQPPRHTIMDGRATAAVTGLAIPDAIAAIDEVVEGMLP